MEWDKPSTSYQTETPLFPAYSESNQTQTSLFPAYSSLVQNEEEKKDWLCNSSFTESAFKQVCSENVNQEKLATSSENNIVESEIKPKSISSKAKKKEKSHKRRKYEKYSELSFAVPESESIICQLKKKTFLEETGLSLERAFRTDSTKDPDNLMFDCFERTKTASYHSNINAPLGLSSKELHIWTLLLPKKKEKKTIRYFSKSFLKVLKAEINEVLSKSKEPLGTASLEYIPLLSNSNKHIFSEKTNIGPDFIDISSSWKSEKTETREEISNDKNSEVNNELKNQVIHYNKKLSEEPHNIQLWLDFVDFQNKVFLSEKNDIYSETNITEKKLSILERALKFNPKNIDLHIMRLKLSQNMYSSSELSSMWENLIFFNPNNPQVWQEYVLYKISNLTTFNVRTILKLFSKCLKTLSDISEGENQSCDPCSDVVLNMLGIFKQLCFILKSCGHTEKVIGAYQALTEFNIFCDPCIVSLPVNEKIACFEPFWDSGAQRIGEKDAIGWAATVQQKKILNVNISTDSDLSNIEDEILSEKLTLSETWLKFEKLRETHHWHPWKPNPEFDQTVDDIEDLDRTVSFDDVSKFLFSINEEEHKFLLVMQFIDFIGFDPHLLNCSMTKVGMRYNCYDLEGYGNILNELSCDRMIHLLADPFPSQGCHWNAGKHDFMDRIFSAVIDKFSFKYKSLLTRMWIKFRQKLVLETGESENAKNTGALKKFVKGILKQAENRNCLSLWMEYIYTEWLTDKLGAAKTFHTLLLSSTADISQGLVEFQELWYFVQSFIEINIKSTKSSSDKIMSSNEAVWILFHIATKEKYTVYSNEEIKPTMILKSVSAFKNNLENQLSLLSSVQSTLCYCYDPASFTVLNCAKCFAYFQYFSQGCEAAMQVYDDVLKCISTKISDQCGRYISEQLYVAQAELLNFHTWNSTASTKPLQTFLCSSVKRYPHNSQLLYLLVKLKSSATVISPTRRFFTEILRNIHKTHPITWFYALVAELAIYNSLILCDNNDEYTGTISGMGLNWRIRSLYEKMLQCHSCAHVSVLWRSYLKFEMITQNTERARSVFHRSLQNCGWSKELLLDAVQYFPDKLDEIVAFMTEKHIRIHTPLEEVALLMEHAVGS